MADITLTYKGATIAEISTTGTKTIQTAGKYCEADIGLAYVKPGGGGWQGLRAEVGTFTPETDVTWANAKNYQIPHTLGVVPGFIFVWTNDYDDEWEAGERMPYSNIADFWIDKDDLLPFYQKGDTGDGDSLPYGGYFYWSSTKTIQVFNPSHLGTTAMVNKPTASVFYPPAMYNYSTFRAGVVYNYFIAEKGW